MIFALVDTQMHTHAQERDGALAELAALRGVVECMDAEIEVTLPLGVQFPLTCFDVAFQHFAAFVMYW